MSDKKTILLIDDSATMLMSLKKTLDDIFTVETAVDGVDALTKLKLIKKPDLIITDINMPNMNGIEFIRHARQSLRFTPILTLTTESQQTKREEARKYGATGWLVKPIGANDLLTVIKRVLHV